MRVLVATRRTQGAQRNDYDWTVEGELVLVGALVECSDPDRCGCGRGFPGLASHRATTTAEVVERPHIDRAALGVAIHDSLESQGWLRGLGRGEIAELVDQEVALVAEVARAFPVGTILQRDGGEIWPRQVAA